MTSPETVLNGNSVKTKLYNTPPPYLIVLASSVTTMEVKAIEFPRMSGRVTEVVIERVSVGVTDRFSEIVTEIVTLVECQPSILVILTNRENGAQE